MTFAQAATPYFFNFANQVGIVPKHIFDTGDGGRASGHLARHQPDRHRSVQGRPVLGQQHPVHRQSDVLAAGQAVHPEGGVPGLSGQRSGEPRPRERQGSVGQPVHSEHQEVLPGQVIEQPHVVAAGDERGAVPELGSHARGHQQAGGSPGDRARHRPRAGLDDRRGRPTTRRPTRPASSCRRSRSTTTPRQCRPPATTSPMPTRPSSFCRAPATRRRTRSSSASSPSPATPTGTRRSRSSSSSWSRSAST